jgi:protein CpxP
MKRKVFAVLATLGLSSALLFAYGGDGRGMRDGGMMPKERFVKHLKQLDLTVEQKAKLHDLREAHRDERKADRKMMRKNRADMTPPALNVSAFMTKEKFDKEAFKAAVKKEMEQREAQRAKMRDTMLEKRATHIQEVFDILTPEQREKLIQLSKDDKTPNDTKTEK